LGQQHHVRVHFSAELAKRHGMVLANPGAPPATKRERALAAREYRERFRIAEEERLAREREADRKAQEERERKREAGEDDN
jgi:hypothetical protein